MKKQKNRFMLFVFSLCPGAGHMYMGLMKMGLSFMLGFMGLIAVVGITEIAVLAVFPVTLYIYAFFTPTISAGWMQSSLRLWRTNTSSASVRGIPAALR